MTAAVFITGAGEVPPRWKAAFPDLVVVPAPASTLQPSGAALYWVHIDSFDDDGAVFACISRLIDADVPVIALSNTPTEDRAFALLSRGVRGYCHSQADPAQLREVAQVVGAGGLWMPPELVQRVASLATRLDEGSGVRDARSLDTLSAREEQVALLVARGFNNREIAAALEVSERTVKANLTSIFDKLKLRDRVQLALYVNRLPIH